MSLKFSMKSMEGLDPAVAALYTEDNGNFVLTGIDNVVHKSKIDEFRTNNIDLMNQLEAYKDVDLEVVEKTKTDLKEALIQLENKGEIDEETVNKIVESRVSKIKEDSVEAITAKDNAIKSLTTQLNTLVLDGAVSDSAVEHKIADSAVTDVKLRVQSVFRFEDGKPVAYGPDGKKMYADDGVSELTVDKFVKGLIKTSPHLFQQSVSSGLSTPPGYTGDVSKLSATQKIKLGL